MTPKTSTAVAGEAGSRQLNVTIVPNNADNKEVIFNIDNATELTVSSIGKIEWTENTPPGVYTTTITTVDGGFTATHTLTLEEPEQEGVIIPRELEMLKGTTEQLSARETVRWHSANESVISVNDSGVVTANGVGVAEVIATTNGGKEDQITVVVYQTEETILDPDDRVAPTTITLEPSEHTLPELGVNKLLKIHIEPPNAETDVEWTSSDESIVMFNDRMGGRGWIMSRGAGTAIITAKSTVNSVEGTATIHVVNG